MKIKLTHHFQRSYRRYARKHYPVARIDDCVEAIVKQDSVFLARHKNHHLIHQFYELHIDRQYNDDWLLIYAFDKDTQELTLVLVDTGSHDDLDRIIGFKY